MRVTAPEHGDAIVAGIVAATRRLETFPRIGRVVPEFERATLREVIFRHYRIPYSLSDDMVFVITVLHASMDVAARLRELGEQS